MHMHKFVNVVSKLYERRVPEIRGKKAESIYLVQTSLSGTF